MLISWNVRGLNRAGKYKEISSHLLSLKADINILLETRVKKENAKNIRDKLKLPGQYLDNYSHHINGRIWLNWNDGNIDIISNKITDQMVHCEVRDAQGGFKFWLTVVYAHNKLELRRKLWHDIEHSQQPGPWCIVGDFNNVLRTKDRIGGNRVTETEYIDLQNMMQRIGLFEMESKGDYYTWFNKHNVDPIYSRIDRVLGNVDWFQTFQDVNLNVLAPNVSDHAILHVIGQENSDYRKRKFKFLNCVTKMAGYSEIVARSWHTPVNGSRPMEVVWKKLKRLQKDLGPLTKHTTQAKVHLAKAREALKEAQQALNDDRMNKEKIDLVKDCTEDVIKWNEIDEAILKQRSKIDWLKLGDGNNSYFHASIRAKNKATSIETLQLENGSIATEQVDIQAEVLRFYGDLMGKQAESTQAIDIVAMREGYQIDTDQADMLTGPVTEKEIVAALHSIGDLKSPGIDGYGAKFFKESWQIVGRDVIAAVREFFEHDQIFLAVNCTLIRLIPKHEEAKIIKEYRPIAGCTTLYKIISKILTMRLSKIMANLIGCSQAAFVPG
ncbi:unnamed protein product [Lathyrus sativus]|nr:unnamed protein product [Lathyrus sativus]